MTDAGSAARPSSPSPGRAFTEAVALLRDDETRQGVAGWLASARGYGACYSRVKGEPCKPEGAFVAENVINESHLQQDAFVDFLTELAGTPACDSDDFIAICRKFPRRGSEAKLPAEPCVLRRLIRPHGLLKAARKPLALESPNDADPLQEWTDFLTAWHAATEQEQAKILRSVQLCSGESCFAFYLETDGTNNPTMPTVNQLYTRLGLNWCDDESSTLPVAVLIDYYWKDVSDVRVPTIADAEWQPCFVSALPDAPCGRTCDRCSTEKEPTKTGFPEVVHQRRDLDCIRDRKFKSCERLTR